MATPVLVLQYPDTKANRTVALAATKDWGALVAFKRAALAEARLSCVRWEGDSLLYAYGVAELERLESLLEDIVPESEGSIRDDGSH